MSGVSKERKSLRGHMQRQIYKWTLDCKLVGEGTTTQKEFAAANDFCNMINLLDDSHTLVMCAACSRQLPFIGWVLFYCAPATRSTNEANCVTSNGHERNWRVCV
jgi:hypothetical protein